MSGSSLFLPLSLQNTPILEKVDKKIDDPVYRKLDPLRRFNLILFVIHLVIMVMLLIYFRSVESNGDSVNGINLDLFEHAFELNTNTNFYDVVSKEVLKVKKGNVTSLIITFFAVTAGFHLLYYINPNNIYLDAVKKGNNFLRWIEYSVSATIMIIIIALLSGVKNINNYILIVVSSIAIMSTGQMYESASNPTSKWIPIIVGFLLLMGIFTVVFRSFRNRLKEAETAGFEVPRWLFGVVYVMFAFYASFGAVPVAQMLFKGRPIMYEYAYLILSLVSKASLGLLVAIGFGQRSSSQEPS